MPVIVTPTPPVLPPSEATSGDGKLYAKGHPAGGGVRLKATITDFSITDEFESNVTGWATVGTTTSTIARTTSSPITGTGSMLWSWTGTSAQEQIRRTFSSVASASFDRRVTLIFNAISSVDISRVRATFGDTIEIGSFQAGLVRKVVMRGILRAGASLTSVSLLKEASAAGNLKIDSVVMMVNPPIEMIFTRDGQPVRSGNPAGTSGGVANAYDFEARNGRVASWVAQPVYLSPTGEKVLGPATQPVSITPPDLTGEYSMWIKSITDPYLSMRVIGMYPSPVIAYDGRDTVTPQPGSMLSAGSWDVPTRSPEAWVVKTKTVAEYEDLSILLRSGPVLVQHSVTRGRDDLYGLMKSISTEDQFSAKNPHRLTTFVLIPISRPPTDSAPLIIPGASYDDVRDNQGTYNNVAATYASYDAIVAV